MNHLPIHPDMSKREFMATCILSSLLTKTSCLEDIENTSYYPEMWKHVIDAAIIITDQTLEKLNQET